MHAFAWIGWLTASLVALLGTRNPLYLLLILLCLALVAASLDRRVTYRPVSFSPFKLGLATIGLSTAFNFLTAHFGDTVLFRLPDGIPYLGGPYTLEALAFGLLNGMVLTGVLSSFAVLNLALPVSAFVRLIPRAFHNSAIIVSIALTFVPNTLRQLSEIREAQAVRGHRVRGLRDWVPLFIPLLVGGLEKAFQLGEAMTARGFASAQDGQKGNISRIALACGLALVLVGWVLRWVWQNTLAGNVVLLSGLVILAGALWWLSGSIPHTSYRRKRWALPDSLITLAALVTVGVFLVPLSGISRDTLFYYPYPKLGMPGFDFAIGISILGLLGPLAASATQAKGVEETRP